jgi:hypothetical protein
MNTYQRLIIDWLRMMFVVFAGAPLIKFLDTYHDWACRFAIDYALLKEAKKE